MVYPSSIDPLITAQLEPLYRLALLVTGAPRAAVAQFQASYRALTPNDPAADQAFLRGLIPRQARYGHWQPGPNELQRAQLQPTEARTLLHVLARRTPAERLAIGLVYLRGMDTDAIAQLFGSAVLLDIGQALSMFRVQAAQAFGQIAADADLVQLADIDGALDGRIDAETMNLLRGQLFADDELRAQRDQLMLLRERLLHILPGLFAVPAPANLLNHLRPAKPRRRMRQRLPVAASIGLIATVFAVAALIVIGPNLLQRPTATRAPQSAADVLNAAIHRFDQSQLTGGVLHERYQVENNGPTYVIERWYDYGTPGRIAIEVRDGINGEAIFGLRADGKGQIQYQTVRNQSTRGGWQLDYQLQPEQIQSALPVLRNILTPNMIGDGMRPQVDISGLYLSQARTLGATLLGETTSAGRTGWLLRYTTDRLPTEPNPSVQRSVLLTIDSQYSTLLDVTILAEGEGESLAVRPWRTEAIELLDTVADTQFVFDNTTRIRTVDGGHSLLLPRLATNQMTSLRDVQQLSEQTLLVPQELPSTMRGVVISFNRSMNRYQNSGPFGVLYEGEFQSVLIGPALSLLSDTTYTWHDEQTIGDYRYRLSEPSTQFSNTPNTVAQVYPANNPDDKTIVVLFDAYSAPQDQTAHLESLLGSLVPLTSSNAGDLEARFFVTPNAGGE